MAINRSTKYPGRWDAPSATNLQGKFKNRTAPGSLDGSYIEKDWMNDIDALRQSIMNAAGTSINTLVDEIGANQAYRALLELIQGRAGMLTDTGAANAYVLTSNANSEPFTAYFDGMEVNFKAANSNTGASTVNIDGLGVESIVDFKGSALVAGDIEAGTVISCKYDFASGSFRLNRRAGNGFSQLMSGNGWCELPNGLIFQWGTATVGYKALTAQTITFPIQFPSACLIVTSEIQAHVPEEYSGYYWKQSSTSTTQVVYTYTESRRWFAIGY